MLYLHKGRMEDECGQLQIYIGGLEWSTEFIENEDMWPLSEPNDVLWLLWSSDKYGMLLLCSDGIGTRCGGL